MVERKRISLFTTNEIKNLSNFVTLPHQNGTILNINRHCKIQNTKVYFLTAAFHSSYHRIKKDRLLEPIVFIRNADSFIRER